MDKRPFNFGQIVFDQMSWTMKGWKHNQRDGRMTDQLMTLTYFGWSFIARPSECFFQNLAKIKLLISPTLSHTSPATQAFPFPNNAASYFVYKHCFFHINMCIRHFNFNNKVDLSQVTSILISKKRLSWKPDDQNSIRGLQEIGQESTIQKITLPFILNSDWSLDFASTI